MAECCSQEHKDLTDSHHRAGRRFSGLRLPGKDQSGSEMCSVSVKLKRQLVLADRNKGSFHLSGDDEKYL